MSKSTNTEALQELPSGFVPGDHDVVIGKGKKFYFHTGNQWLRTLVASMLDEYKQAQTKSDKSNIISDVVEYVRQHGRFVKRDLKSGKWVYAEPLLCREKCSQTFRDNLAETYRSSNVAKRNKRRAEQQEKKRLPDAKRMRVAANVPQASTQAPPQLNVAHMPNLTTTNVNMGMPNLNAQLQQFQQQQQPNLFDLDMPLWSPKQNSVALLPNSLDFSSLTRRSSLQFSGMRSGRSSITGTAGGNPLQDNSGMNNGFHLGNLNLNPQANLNNLGNHNTANGFQLSGLSSMNLLQNLPDILNNLSQIAAAGNNNAAALAQDNQNSNNPNPFEPTPFTAQLPPLTGDSTTSTTAAASMPTLDSSSMQVVNFEPRPMQEKRHSLAMGIADLDWLKNLNAAGNNVNSSTNDEQAATATSEFPKISAAFAA